MIVFKIAGNKSNIPTVWNEVTFSQYIYHIIPRTLTESIHCFTGIPLETLHTAKLNNVEKIGLALSFMTLSPKMERTPMVDNYLMPVDPKFESLQQFEDMRSIMKGYPQKERKEFDYTDYEKEADIYLTACAIYLQKIKDGEYDTAKVTAVKEDLKNKSCIEVISNGAFFLSRALNIPTPSLSLYQRMSLALKRFLRALPGYQRTLDFLLHSHGSQEK